MDASDIEGYTGELFFKSCSSKCKCSKCIYNSNLSKGITSFLVVLVFYFFQISIKAGKFL